MTTRSNAAATRIALAATALFALAAALHRPPGAAAARRGPAPASFLGAGPGLPVPFAPVPLPLVDPGGPVEHAFQPSRPFDPGFDDLVNGEIVITTNSQMHAVWLRLFAEPYDPGLFDFQRSFVVLMGGGLMHPDFGFAIAAVESYEGAFEPVMKFRDPLLEPALAITAVTSLPGPPPKKADPVYHVSAVQIDLAFLADALFHRDVFAAP